jgi:hypothetical protein
MWNQSNLAINENDSTMTDNNKYQQQMHLMPIQESPYNNQQGSSGNHTNSQQKQLSSQSQVE